MQCIRLSQNIICHKSTRRHQERACLPYAANCWGLRISFFHKYISNRSADCYFFNDLIINKVKLIRTSIDQHKLQAQNCTTIAQTSLKIFESFHPVPIAQLYTMIKSSKPTSSTLDPILLLECPDDILPSLTHIIITSTLSFQFSTNMKTAMVRPC